MTTAETLVRPIPNSYWVVPGRLLAGEYPGVTPRRTMLENMHVLLDAGVTHFIDLTEEGVDAPYSVALAVEANRRVLAGPSRQLGRGGVVAHRRVVAGGRELGAPASDAPDRRAARLRSQLERNTV